MQVSGRIAILAAIGFAVAMTGGAWWYQYRASRQAAAFWGTRDATLLVRSDHVALVELGDRLAENQAEETVAGRSMAASHDLSGQPGLVHLRHAFTQDANVEWDGRRTAPAGESGPWAYALVFSTGGERLVVLLSEQLDALGRLRESPGHDAAVDVVPCPRLAGPVRKYLTDVGALDGDVPER